MDRERETLHQRIISSSPPLTLERSLPSAPEVDDNGGYNGMETLRGRTRQSSTRSLP
jgi:hypothetical protein